MLPGGPFYKALIPFMTSSLPPRPLSLRGLRLVARTHAHIWSCPLALVATTADTRVSWRPVRAQAGVLRGQGQKLQGQARRT